MAEQKILLGNVRGEQGPAGPNMVSSDTTTSGFENGHVLFNNNGKVGAKKLSASDVGALAKDGTAQKASKITTNGYDFNAAQLQAINKEGSPSDYFVRAKDITTYAFYEMHVENLRGEEEVPPKPACVAGLQCYPAGGSYNKYSADVMRCITDQYLSGAYGISVITQSGTKDCTVKNAVQIAGSSSKRYKDDVHSVDTELLDKVMSLDVIDFIYNQNAPEQMQDDKRHFGVFAEEVFDVLPNSVVLDEEGLPSAVIYSDFIPLLLAQLQRQKAQIDALEQCIRKLEECKA